MRAAIALAALLMAWPVAGRAACELTVVPAQGGEALTLKASAIASEFSRSRIGLQVTLAADAQQALGNYTQAHRGATLVVRLGAAELGRYRVTGRVARLGLLVLSPRQWRAVRPALAHCAPAAVPSQGAE